MSQSRQVDLNGNNAAPESYLTKQFPGDGPESQALDVDGSNEWYCTECVNRVTRSPIRPVEYGHETSCSHSIAEVGDD